MSSSRVETAFLTWREEIFQDAAERWGEERPSLKHLAGAFLQDPGLASAFLFRLSQRLDRRGHPRLASLAGRVNLALHGCQIHCRATIGPGLILPHPSGVVVGWGVQAGRSLTLYQNVTLGARTLDGAEYPVLGNQVLVYPNSLILGAIHVGDRATVGAGSVVLHDVGEGETVVGAPATGVKVSSAGRRRNSGGVE
jgi:serine O-acetyltransferase